MTSMVELGAQALRFVNNLKEAEARGAESILSLMGLQRRQGIARPLLWFAAGATVAAGAALLLAPMKGEELVDRIARGLRRATSTVEDATKTAAAAVRSPAPNAEPPGQDGFDAKTDHV